MKNGLVLVLLQQLDRHLGADRVGLLAVFAIGREPTRRAAKLARA